MPKMKSHGMAVAEATTDREAATEQTKKSTRNHEDNERVLSNAINQINQTM